ncbi:cysteine-rich venom protein [Thalassophryne amazonica]|uniref:cysteine-rich venom protein n=1 Tax=Thalassophryne amazonica TaxID=390379 RepID=UPI001471B43C|nr:cysteine-rich venom protein [Thalassophryne amazonica]
MSVAAVSASAGTIKSVRGQHQCALFKMHSQASSLLSSEMFVFLIFMVALHQVHSTSNVCFQQGYVHICTEKTAVQDEIINLHNFFRKSVHPPAANMLKMGWSDELEANVQAWLNKCILAHGEPSTRMIKGYEVGENLFYAGTLISWTDVITAWHSEVENYQYPTDSTNGKSVGHYTQVVWNSSYKVGCGVTMCKDIYFYGCHYYRAGNFRGWPPYKIGEPCASCPNACDEDKLCTNPCPYINWYINCPQLKRMTGCSNHWVYDWCPASCKCTTEIIPIY